MKLSKILLKDWIDLVDEELTENLIQQLDVMYKTSEIYPYKDKVFRVFQELKPDDVKVVLLAMDPYPGYYNNAPSACGRAFATENGYLNPSLRNLLKELKDDVNIIETDYSLQSWVDQGVFLLNTALTVEAGKPGSHINLWKPFMKSLIPNIKNKTWILLGANAQSWEQYIDGEIIKAAHPSPMARGKFFGSKIFSKTWKKI
jgi:uracil-DNA glycosylase